MIQIFLFVLTIFAIALTCMAVGVIFGDRALKGTCGGLNAVAEKRGELPTCDICGASKPTDCRNNS